MAKRKEGVAHPSGVLSAITVNSEPLGHVQTSDVDITSESGFSAVVSDACLGVAKESQDNTPA